MLFGVCIGPNYEIAERSLTAMRDDVDGIELRLDLFAEINILKLKDLLKSWDKKVLLTFRKKSQGGGFSGSLQEQEEIWKELSQLSVDFVDLEYDAPQSLYELARKIFPGAKVISSYHNFEKTPVNLTEILLFMKLRNADIYKIATMATSSLDALRMLEWVKDSSQQNEEVIGICMGDEGKITRILSPIVGSYLNYVSLEGEAAPGQISLQELLGLYRYRELNKETKVFAVIGYPVETSLGPSFHNPEMARCNRNGIYVKIPIQKDELQELFHYIYKLGFFRGLSVTMPLKEDVIECLDQVDSEAKAIGAVNTVVFEKGKSLGYNTDGIGATCALEEKISLSQKKIVVIGSGGSAKAIIYALVQKQALVTILNRTEEKALDLAHRLGCRGGSLGILRELCLSGYDVLVNTTPDPMPFDEEDICEGCIAMDIKTFPKMSLFLEKAKEKNCTLVFGREMFYFQALEQQALWFPLELSVL
ncbi:MAG: shikimate dehydrogenase [Chlamydiae bacterium]|nr:shikimate dehydrogenase [Chlamydiota bacterium]